MSPRGWEITDRAAADPYAGAAVRDRRGAVQRAGFEPPPPIARVKHVDDAQAIVRQLAFEGP